MRKEDIFNKNGLKLFETLGNLTSGIFVIDFGPVTHGDGYDNKKDNTNDQSVFVFILKRQKKKRLLK